jgi:hypothetical protein
MGSDGETPLDQRLADAFVSLLTAEGPSGSAGSARVPLVVAHVPFEVLGDPESELPGALERGGLISAAVVRRLVCDGEVIVALDDRLGHTMYEGRARRYPTPTQRREVLRRDRHCAFPGCANVVFTNCHHIEQWTAGGLSDLSNLVLLCKHHHDLIHTKVWSLSGDANVELRFVGPTGQVMTTRPSRLWTQVTDPTVLAERRAQAGRGGGDGDENAHRGGGEKARRGGGEKARRGGGGTDSARGGGDRGG